MRAIKFRGKCLLGYWRYGSLYVQTETDCEIITRNDDGSWGKSIVVPNTIGQFTGLHDKNGTEIYEGDIVSSGATTGIIVYDCEQAGFVVQKEKSIELRFYSLLGIEVIGNIHDKDLTK